MGGERTINIDLSLFTGGKSKGSGSGSKPSTKEHNKTVRKERKTRPKPSGPSATSLRKNLLAKIKEHQQKEAKHKELPEPTPTPSGNSSYGGLDGNAFEDEFTRSLAYLSALAKTRETMRAEKKSKAKLKFRNSSVENKTAPTSNATHNTTLRRVPERPTGQNASHSNVPEISLEMPPEFDITPKVEVQVLPSVEATPHIAIKQDPPYGVMKGGKKPTYRDYSRTQRNPSSLTSTPKPAAAAPRHQPKPVISVAEHIRDETSSKQKQPLQKRLVIPSSECDAKTDLKNSGKRRKSKTVKRTTSTRHFKLGKDSKRRVIAVFIKNNKTRRRLKLEIGQLKRVPINDVKSYLRKHNLLKVGSSAPNDVLRHMYEQSVLSGDIHNLAKDTLIHNFLSNGEA